MILAFAYIALIVFAAASAVLYFLYRKNVSIWISSYIRSSIFSKASPDPGKPVHIYFCFTDHYEPGQNPDYARALRRVTTWCEKYPRMADRHKDSSGRPPQHTFFYPAELYEPELLDLLADLCKRGYGDVEIHLHHDNDTAENLAKVLTDFKETLFNKHGLLRKDPVTGEMIYGFIHGNWALDNSLKNGSYCGVNNELTILKRTGCYADFTLASAPSNAQTSKINSIYYATDDPDRPKSHDDGIDVEAGKAPTGDLMIIQGPLTLNWQDRKWGLFPRIENGGIGDNKYSDPTPNIIDSWIDQHIHVKGEPNHVFVKVYSHGTAEHNESVLLGDPLDRMYQYLEDNYNDGEEYVLHYMTAYEIYRKIKELEAWSG